MSLSESAERARSVAQTETAHLPPGPNAAPPGGSGKGTSLMKLGENVEEENPDSMGETGQPETDALHSGGKPLFLVAINSRVGGEGDSYSKLIIKTGRDEAPL